MVEGVGIPRGCDFEGQWDLITGLPQDWGKQRHHSWRAHTNSCAHQDPGERSSDPKETDPGLLQSVQESLAEAWVGGGLLQGWGH